MLAGAVLPESCCPPTFTALTRRIPAGSYLSSCRPESPRSFSPHLQAGRAGEDPAKPTTQEFSPGRPARPREWLGRLENGENGARLENGENGAACQIF